MIVFLQKGLRVGFLQLEALFDKIFSERWNPWYQLGALSFFYFWILVVSGVYLYILFDTSIFGAYQSVQQLTHDQWYFGGVMRSLHRYATDAMLVCVTLHFLREFSLGRYRGVRWFSWLSGVPLLWFLFAAAIGGYWLVWDQLAHYIAVVTSEWIDWLPSFGQPMARNFLNERTLSDRFFSLLVFLHIAIPLFLLLGMFIHIKRISKAKTNPARGLMVGNLVALLLLSLIKPAISHAPADMQQMPAQLGIDWFVMNIYPLIDYWGPGETWALLLLITLLLSILPWLSPEKNKPSVAVVDPDNCNGCGWCFQDCPYEAITMKTHDYKTGRQQAVVDPELCVSCGICAGACPSATPFRSVEQLMTGIDMPDYPVNQILRETEKKIESLRGDGKLIIFGCRHAASLNDLVDQQTAVVTLSCAAQLPPSFVDYSLRPGRCDGVLITGCGEDCFYRRGSEWVELRFSNQRMPHLRTSVAKHRVKIAWAGPLAKRQLQSDIAAYRKRLKESRE